MSEGFGWFLAYSCGVIALSFWMGCGVGYFFGRLK